MIDVNECLRRLEPVLGERADKLWLIYLASDFEQKRKIEEIIRILCERHLNQDYKEREKIFLPPPPKKIADGDYRVGGVLYPEGLYCPFGIREEEWIQHIGIFGRSGSGKTNVAYVIINELKKKQKPFLIFDWKKNYRGLMGEDDYKDILVFTVGTKTSPFFFNPLIPPPGTPPKVWLKKLVEITAHSFFLGAGVMHLLQNAIDFSYKKYDVYDGNPERYPTFRDIQEYIDKMRTRGREMLWHASAKRALGSLTFGPMDEVVNSPVSFSIEELLSRDIVLELDAMTDDCKTFFIEALLLWIHHYRMHEGKREEFKHAIIIEEAHHILLKKKQQAEGGEAITDVVLREIRELGESIILIDQHPSLISIPALGNTNITIGMNLKHGADVSALVNAMLLTKDQYHYLGMIEVGKAIVKIQSRYPNPFLVSFPWAKSQRKISNEDIKERMEGFYRKYSLKKLERQRQKEISVSSHYDLSPQERDFLIDVFTNPFSSMSERYKRLGFNNRLGNQIKDCLIRKGLFNPVGISVRNGRIKLLDITEKGAMILIQMGYERKLQKGEGGIEHEYWKRKIGDQYRKKGYEVFEEYEIGKGKKVDLLAKKGDERIAIEIETGKSDIEENIRKVSGLGCQVLFYAANGEVEGRIREILEREGFGDIKVRKVE
jgi:hypothetical protein